jgi:hypothetical protein
VAILFLTIQNGFDEPDSIVSPEISSFPNISPLNFGDVWMADQILKQIKLADVLDNRISGAANAYLWIKVMLIRMCAKSSTLSTIFLVFSR